MLKIRNYLDFNIFCDYNCVKDKNFVVFGKNYIFIKPEGWYNTGGIENETTNL